MILRVMGGAGFGAWLAKLFVDVNTLPFDAYGAIQLTFLTAVYIYLSYRAAKLSEVGIECLLLVPGWSAVVGTIIMPLCAAFPEAVILLTAGLGSKAGDGAISVGVGSLTGITLLELTVPLFLVVWAGRVSVLKETFAAHVARHRAAQLKQKDGEGAALIPPASQRGAAADKDKDRVAGEVAGDKGHGDGPAGPAGVCNYEKPEGVDHGWRKLYPPGDKSMTGTAVEYGPVVHTYAKIMLFSLGPYIVIQSQYSPVSCMQIPALIYGAEVDPESSAANVFSAFLLVSMILAAMGFVALLAYTHLLATRNVGGNEALNSRMDGIRLRALEDKTLTLRAACAQLTTKIEKERARMDSQTLARIDAGEEALFNALSTSTQRSLGETLKPFFDRFDVHHSGRLDKDAVKAVFVDLGEKPSDKQLKEFMQMADSDGSGFIEFGEFLEAMLAYMLGELTFHKTPRGKRTARGSVGEIAMGVAMLSDGEIQKGGTARSDATGADAHGHGDGEHGHDHETGDHEHTEEEMLTLLIGEMILAYNHGTHKTRRTVTMVAQEIEAATVMHNTLCLFALLLALYLKGVPWTFYAEAVTLVTFTFLVAYILMRKTRLYLWEGVLLLVMFPLSLAFMKLMALSAGQELGLVKHGGAHGDHHGDHGHGDAHGDGHGDAHGEEGHGEAHGESHGEVGAQSHGVSDHFLQNHHGEPAH
uniref:EF-hand domain-containing protein n=1 Tax=Chromera velia CCMP2878 TaxID=1169474 RepID=A0A0G4HX05_9ALVE|eukprot:Cvel_9164.t1-p1 / transcript=Cvel_9164.t1 / gene=Cvel_9164 / organism=Chromera_velia_CCMP2878 / gene_product=Squidulin, putative / transcript_product=Squidulin, putative / location=Cvel_scaffold521:76100-82235(-) / protein_length=700 / sequence_SO=supercontig / SO=protein_coding / is_pseudo=false